MTLHTRPDPETLPSTGQLLRATVIAIAVAAVLLVTVVLPAEYGIDPTGLGGRLGLTSLSSAAPPPPASAPAEPTVAAAEPLALVKRTDAFRSDEMSLTLLPGKGAEIKATMGAGDSYVFSWTTDGGPVNFDMHGERPNAGDEFTSYWKDKQQTSGHGSFVAPFAGSHGWYWANRGGAPVTVTVKTSGFYEKLYKP